MRKVRERTERVERVFARIKEARAKRQALGGIVPDFGWFEDQVQNAIDKAHSIVGKARHVDCAKAAGGAVSGGYFLKKIGASVAGDYPEMGALVAAIGGAAEGLGAALGGAAAAGAC